MSIGLIAKKIGMTRLFLEDGKSVPVTVLEVEANRVIDLKTKERDGYTAVKMGAFQKSSKHVSKPMLGVFQGAQIGALSELKEFKVSEEELEKYSVGDSIDASLFSEGQFIDVQALSRGKGYAGTVKRWNFKMQDATHGNSLSHRAPGSIGQCQTPGRVFKGKKMAGRLGHKQVTVQNLSIVKVDKNLILIKGALPGFPGTIVSVKSSVKKKVKNN